MSWERSLPEHLSSVYQPLPTPLECFLLNLPENSFWGLGGYISFIHLKITTNTQIEADLLGCSSHDVILNLALVRLALESRKYRFFLKKKNLIHCDG